MRLLRDLLILLFFSTLIGADVKAEDVGLAEEQTFAAAVLKFDGKDEELGSIYADFFVTLLASNPKMKLLERENIERILEEQKLTISGFINTDNLTPEQKGVLTGNLEKVDYLVLGRYLDFDSSTAITVRLVKVETGEILFTDMRQVNKDNRFHLLYSLANRLSISVTGTGVERSGNRLYSEDFVASFEKFFGVRGDFNMPLSSKNFGLLVKLNKENTKADRPHYRSGEKISLKVSAEKDCYLILYTTDSYGNSRILFPNEAQQNSFIRGGVEIEIPSEDAPFEFELSGQSGIETIWAIATPVPLESKEHLMNLFKQKQGFGASVSEDFPRYAKEIKIKLRRIAKERFDISVVELYLEEK